MSGQQSSIYKGRTTLRGVQKLKSDGFSLFKVFVESTIFNLQGKTKLRGVQQLKWFPGIKIPDCWFPLILRIKHWIGRYNNWAQYQNWVSWRLPGHYRLGAALYYKYVVSIEKCLSMLFPLRKLQKIKSSWSVYITVFGVIGFLFIWL